jgi:hypothetical protein
MKNLNFKTIIIYDAHKRHPFFYIYYKYNTSNIKSICRFSTTDIKLYPREDYENRSENKLCRYDVLTHLTNKEIILKKIIQDDYDKTE